MQLFPLFSRVGRCDFNIYDWSLRLLSSLKDLIMAFLTGWMKVSDLPLRMPLILPHSFVVSELGCQCLYKQLLSHPGAWSVPSLTS